MKYIIIVMLLLMIANSNAQSFNNIEELYVDKQYNQFIKEIQKRDNDYLNHITLKKIVITAISIDKGEGWDNEVYKNIRLKLLYTTDGLYLLKYFKDIFKGNYEDIGNIFKYNYSLSEYTEINNELKNNGYNEISYMLRVISLLYKLDNDDKSLQYENIKVGIEELCLCSDNEKRIVTTELYKLWRNRLNMDNLVSKVALDIYIEARKDIRTEEKSNQYLDIAREFGRRSNVISMKTAQDLATQNRTHDAILLTCAIADIEKMNVETQYDAVRFLKNHCKDMQTTESVMLNAVRNLPEPDVRALRLEYLSDTYTRELGLDTIRISDEVNELLQADCQLVKGKPDEAAKKYREILNDVRFPIGQRTDAWMGLMQTDPTAAFQVSQSLVDEIARFPEKERDALITWMAWEFWHHMEYTIPHRYGVRIQPWQKQSRKVNTAADWETAAAQLIERLLKVSPVTLLRPNEHHEPKTFRVPAAIIFLTAQQPERALEVLKQRIEWQEPVPLWATLPGDPVVPRPVSSPRDGEFENLVLEVINLRPAAGERDETNIRFIDCAIRNSIKTLATCGEKTVILPMRVVAVGMKEAATLLNAQTPATPATPVTLGGVSATSFPEYVRAALVNDVAAKKTQILLEEGLQPALARLVTDPQLLEQLFQATVDTLGRYKDVEKDPRFFYRQIQGVELNIKDRRDIDMKPYVARLWEKYPKPEAPK